MTDLRKELVKLAKENPEMRKHLVPILKTATTINFTPSTTAVKLIEYFMIELARAVIEVKNWGNVDIGSDSDMSGAWSEFQSPGDIAFNSITFMWNHKTNFLRVSEEGPGGNFLLIQIPLSKVWVVKIPVLASLIASKIP
ncbi:MAG: hypothetical protein WC824_14570 [Bacteroidota bacterium]